MPITVVTYTDGTCCCTDVDTDDSCACWPNNYCLVCPSGYAFSDFYLEAPSPGTTMAALGTACEWSTGLNGTIMGFMRVHATGPNAGKPYLILDGFGSSRYAEYELDGPFDCVNGGTFIRTVLEPEGDPRPAGPETLTLSAYPCVDTDTSTCPPANCEGGTFCATVVADENPIQVELADQGGGVYSGTASGMSVSIDTSVCPPIGIATYSGSEGSFEGPEDFACGSGSFTFVSGSGSVTWGGFSLVAGPCEV
jgi:hypothetical protein